MPSHDNSPSRDANQSDLSGANGPAGASARALIQAELRAAAPLIEGWIDATLAKHASQSKSVAELGFPRLASYYPQSFLESANVIAVPKCPIPPLDKLGLDAFAGIMPGDAAGITYKDTFFVYKQGRKDESLHFHELVHVAQWQILGPQKFIELYAAGLMEHGYRNSPLEEMAYDMQARFDRGGKPFDAMSEIKSGLAKLVASYAS